LSEFGVLDVVPAVFTLDNSINPDVEFHEVLNSLLHTLGSSGVGPQVSGLAEEVSTEALVRVVQDSVLVCVAEGGGILDVELDVPDELARSWRP